MLLVEDEVVLRMSTTDMLEQLGCFVAGVGSGEQALELLTRGGVVRSAGDRPWPARHERRGAGGAGAAAQFPSLPVVIASGYGRSAHAGGEGLQFISKPYSPIDLQQALDHAARLVAPS